MDGRMGQAPPQSSRGIRQFGIRAAIFGDVIRVGRPWAGICFDATRLARPMAMADAMIESLMRHCRDLRLADGAGSLSLTSIFCGVS